MKGHALLHVFPAWARPQKRPSFSKNDGTTDHRSGPNTVSGERWDVRAFVHGPTPRLKRTPTSPRQIRPVIPGVGRRPKNDHRFRKTMGRPAIVPDKRSFVHGPFAVQSVCRYRPAQSDPFFQSCGSGPKTTSVTYTFAPCFSEIRSSRHLPI